MSKNMMEKEHKKEKRRERDANRGQRCRRRFKREQFSMFGWKKELE